MTTLRDADAFAHPAYNDSVRHAADRAYRDKGESYVVYWDGEAVYVRISTAACPPTSKIVCIAQYWADGTVQLRFDGARSEWVKP